MNITEVRITPLDNGKTLALANITIDAEFVVSGLRVLDGQNGLWVTMPSRKTKDGEYHDIAFPITKDAREQIQVAVLQAYHVKTDPTFQTVAKQQGDATKRDFEKIEVSEDDLPF